MADADNKLAKKAAMKIVLGSDAMSRFTRTPIRIENNNLDDLVSAFKKAGVGITVSGGPTAEAISKNPVSGEFHSTDYANPEDIDSYKQVYSPHSVVTVNTANPSLEDLHRVMFHEDVHALLDKMNYKYQDLPTDPWPWDPVQKAANAFYDANRGGNVEHELPSYMGIYSQKEIPGFSPQDRQAYLTQLQKTMSPTLEQLFNRIIANYNANPSASFGPLQ